MNFTETNFLFAMISTACVAIVNSNENFSIPFHLHVMINFHNNHKDI
jgi:hypothetical protein